MAEQSSILVVEDDRNLRGVIVDFLEDEGYYVKGVSNSNDAFKIVSRRKFNLVITDVRMPGLDGVNGFARLKEKQPDLRCIVMTGYADTEAPIRAIETEVDDYLYKPFKLLKLREVVNRVTDRPSVAAHYLNVLQKAPGKLFAACSGFFKKDKVAILDQVRGRAFQGLYVAIRSKLLGADTANGVFCKLDDYDEDYKSYLADPQEAKLEVMTVKYRDFIKFLAALSRSKTALLGGNRLPPHEFRHLYTAVQAGTITPEELQLAPSLKRIDPNKLDVTSELVELRKKMWVS